MNMAPSEKPGFILYSFDSGNAEKATAIISLASVGSMKTKVRRDNFCKSLGINSEHLLMPHLVHSRNCLAVEDYLSGAIKEVSLEPTGKTMQPGISYSGSTLNFSTHLGPSSDVILDNIASPIEEAHCDGLIVTDSAFIPAVTVADCMPLWIYDASKGYKAVLHSGWKGTGIVRTALEMLISRFGSRKTDLTILCGPCIGPCCYSVPAERAQAFAAEFGVECIDHRKGQHYLDMRRANIKIAQQMGVTSIKHLDFCTFCDSRFGSFRRQGAERADYMIALFAHQGF